MTRRYDTPRRTIFYGLWAFANPRGPHLYVAIGLLALAYWLFYGG